MTEEQFNQLNAKLDSLNTNLVRSLSAKIQLSKDILNRLGLDTTPREFIPYYNPTLPPVANYPEIFNKYGERMEIFFISDRSFAHAPQQKDSRYILWDRYNYGNATHFYKDEEVFRTVGKPKRKYAVVSESASIIPNVYENVLKYRNYVERTFDLLFTYDVRILSTLKNARFVAFPAQVWYGTNRGGGYV